MRARGDGARVCVCVSAVLWRSAALGPLVLLEWWLLLLKRLDELLLLWGELARDHDLEMHELMTNGL